MLYKYNPFIFLLAPLIDESCSYFSLIEYVTILKTQIYSLWRHPKVRSLASRTQTLPTLSQSLKQRIFMKNTSIFLTPQWMKTIQSP